MRSDSGGSSSACVSRWDRVRAESIALVLKQGLVMGGIGVAIGAAAAAFVTRYMDTVLYGVDARDPVTFASVLVVLLAAALLGSLAPALRASRVDPGGGVALGVARGRHAST